MNQRTWLERFAAAGGSAEKQVINEYLQVARQGYTFIVVHVPDERQVEQARLLLASHHASLMHYYMATGIADLSARPGQPEQSQSSQIPSSPAHDESAATDPPVDPAW